MAGLIARLFGGRPRPPDPDPLPGQGGYAMPAGRYGEGGFPGSTSVTRTFGKGTSPRIAKIRADHLGGFEQGLGGPQTRQASFRGDQPTLPRQTPSVSTPQPVLTEQLQASPAEFYGGPKLKTDPPLNDTAGGNPLSEAEAAGGHSVRDGETPMTRRQPQISLDTPGANNVRNEVALRYKERPGQMHVYQSAPRGDTPGSTPVVAQNRFVFAGGGVQTWYMERQMPYTGRGDGARGADLNGQRYYAAGPPAFLNGGQGQFGVSRLRGGKRPVSFTEPAPWTSNFYDTTGSVGTTDNPGTPSQAPDLVYVSPQAPRASNGTGRTG